jgi:hypothetical protein
MRSRQTTSPASEAALLEDVNEMNQRLDALERMLGFESDARKQA